MSQAPKATRTAATRVQPRRGRQCLKARDVRRRPHRQPSGQTVRGDAGSRCLKLVRQYRYGLEHNADATSPRSLGPTSPRQRPARAHRTHRPDSNRGHQPAWDIPIPGRALHRQNPTVCRRQDNGGGKRVRGQNGADLALERRSERVWRQLLLPMATIILAGLEPSSLVHHRAV
jgi:hypothetical protein